MSLRRVVAVTAAALALVAVAAGVAAYGLPAATHVLPAGGRSFLDHRVTWAAGSTLHYGDRSIDVGPGLVQDLVPSGHGVFLRVAEAGERPRWTFFDGERRTDLPGRVDDVEVSPDGHYAGWLDADGPRRPIGRLQQVVVTDLRDGDVVLRTHRGMGDFTDDLPALYSDTEVDFAGFDQRYAYWVDAENARWRWDLRTHQRQRAGGGGPDRQPVGLPWDPQLGRVTSLAHGRAVPFDVLAPAAFLSPDGRYAVRTTLEPGRLPISVAATGRPVRLRNADRLVFFGGWSGPSTLYALVQHRPTEVYDAAARARTPGRIVTCRLPSGRCSTVTEVPGARSLALPGDAASYGD
jgi:hypothetical protein